MGANLFNICANVFISDNESFTVGTTTYLTITGACKAAYLKVLTSKDAKKVYAGIVAAGLRAKETVLETAEKVQASASDVLAEAQEINEARNEEIFEENK